MRNHERLAVGGGNDVIDLNLAMGGCALENILESLRINCGKVLRLLFRRVRGGVVHQLFV
jgi:hypothetical protein